MVNLRFPLLTVLAATGMLGALPIVAAEPPPGTVYAHWSFDTADTEGDVVRDLGPLGLHGTLKTDNNTPIETVAGLRGQALRFPAGHESWLALNKGFTLDPPFTLAVWVKLEGRRASMDILGHKAESWREGSRFVFSPRRMFFEYSDGKQNIQVRNDVHQTKQGQWTFIAVVHDGRHVSLYVDAEEIERQPAKVAVPSPRIAVLGNYAAEKKSSGMIGLMDEFVVLREALSTDGLVELGLWALRDSDIADPQ